MESEDTDRTEVGPQSEEERTAERAEDARSRALVPVSRGRGLRDPGPKLMAGLCYFAWLGWITAPAPLLLLNSGRMRKTRRVPYHLFAAAGWSTFIVVIRAVFSVVTTWLDISQWVHAEAVSNVIPQYKKYRISVHASYSRITNKAFMNEVMEIAGLDLKNETYKFPATWNKTEQVLVVDLNGGV